MSKSKKIVVKSLAERIDELTRKNNELGREIWQWIDYSAGVKDRWDACKNELTRVNAEMILRDVVQIDERIEELEAELVKKDQIIADLLEGKDE